MNPGDDYAGAVSRLVLGRICLTLGWHGIHKIPLDIMTDMLKLYIQKLGKESLRIAELRSRSHVNLSDVECTIKKNWGSNGGGGSEGWGPEDCPNFLEDYLAVDFNAGSSPLRVPLFPKPAETDLNFLKPGSREVLRRAVYINDYFPPMYPEEEEGDEAGDILIDPATDTQSPESSHHGRDLREISSVIMTSAGFISPARQGKLPDARHPPPPPVYSARKRKKIHSDVSNSKKLAIFQKRTKPKPPEEPLKPPPPTSSACTSTTHSGGYSKKTEPLLTPKKEDHIDEVMNSVIEKG
ncbi:TAF3 [Lepeophtheirus salmonis]|uniref:TAF3 n=1 Tax=Lepeophtheirus salmonis TaxID=72036 RepID=A0A7R8CMN3_LEPSM|nr:TAF3 [Lepeophtheirus salmonis]CAF2838990.1 TAF3 [Lepeophtheirus salmonis]